MSKYMMKYGGYEYQYERWSNINTGKSKRNRNVDSAQILIVILQLE